MQALRELAQLNSRQQENKTMKQILILATLIYLSSSKSFSYKGHTELTKYQPVQQLFESLLFQTFIGEPKLYPRLIKEDPKYTKNKVGRRLEKRSPGCLYGCLRKRILHPAQCHSYCTFG